MLVSTKGLQNIVLEKHLLAGLRVPGRSLLNTKTSLMYIRHCSPVNLWQRVSILVSDRVQFVVVHAESSGCILFPHHHNWG